MTHLLGFHSPLLAMFGLNPFEIVLMVVSWAGMIAIVGAIIYTALKVRRLQPMDVCPHCGARLRGH